GSTLTETLDTNTIIYSYNAKNELMSVTQNGVATEYGYNPNGIRTSKSENGITTSYIVDENRDYAQVLIEDDGTTQVSYTYGDDLISQARNGEAYFYHYDGLGSTRSLTDSLGNLANTYDYEAFGGVLGQTGSVENSYLFAGEQLDGSLDQYYLRARYYDQSQGRFSQQDTWMGRNYDPITLHKYLYAHADPGNMIDPSGKFGLSSLGTTLNILGNLMLRASTVYDVFQIATGEKEYSAREFGTIVLLNMLPGKVVTRILNKACKINSFDGATLVATDAGLRPISEIAIGDFVWAFDESNGEHSLQEVVHLIRGAGDKEIVDITLETGEVIRATFGHPFYVKEDAWGWVDAGQLNVGDLLRDAEGGVVAIESVKTALRNTPVFNLTVDKAHTYYVGKKSVLSHNAQKVCNLNGLLIGAKKPRFEPNPKHTLGGAGKKPGLSAGIEPDDSFYAFQKLAVKSAVNGRWYAKSSDGKSIYRYFESNGAAHWSGSTGDKAAKLRLEDIPIEVRRAFGIVR
ncbi:MAG: polymorphic toxin-type HINT domain-containing protein, partial [Candidatus Thiodiazotropha sp.]